MTETTNRRSRTKGDIAVTWIEEFCRVPSGPDKGEPVRLTHSEIYLIRNLYDAPGGPSPDQHMTGELAAYLALYHVCGPPAKRGNIPPPAVLDVDAWTTWNAADSPRLRPFLKREPDAVACPALGTRFPRAA